MRAASMLRAMLRMGAGAPHTAPKGISAMVDPADRRGELIKLLDDAMT
jgi:hypothetical protein